MAHSSYFGFNCVACWLVYENSFDDMTETYTVEQDGAETNNSVINGGVIN